MQIIYELDTHHITHYTHHTTSYGSAPDSTGTSQESSLTKMVPFDSTDPASTKSLLKSVTSLFAVPLLNSSNSWPLRGLAIKMGSRHAADAVR